MEDETAVTIRTRCGWVKFECGELLYGKRFILMLKGAVYKNYLRLAILYESESIIYRVFGINFTY